MVAWFVQGSKLDRDDGSNPVANEGRQYTCWAIKRAACVSYPIVGFTPACEVLHQTPQLHELPRFHVSKFSKKCTCGHCAAAARAGDGGHRAARHAGGRAASSVSPALSRDGTAAAGRR
mmetsp:Transcript_30446/g.49188  ORF Transcript_30446/g.49188 Transcript_30446/m.49188 type:complete len:119 (+) Transcript_30446:188-544(+)